MHPCLFKSKCNYRSLQWCSSLPWQNILYWNQHQHQVLEGCSWSLSLCSDDPPSLTSWMWTGSQLLGHLKEIYVHYTNCHLQIKHLRRLIQWGGLKTYRGSPTLQGITALYSTITFIISLVLGAWTAKKPGFKWQESTACVKLCACKSVFCIKRDGGHRHRTSIIMWLK
jgi:hypothetical protein